MRDLILDIFIKILLGFGCPSTRRHCSERKQSACKPLLPSFRSAR